MQQNGFEMNAQKIEGGKQKEQEHFNRTEMITQYKEFLNSYLQIKIQENMKYKTFFTIWTQNLDKTNKLINDI